MKTDRTAKAALFVIILGMMQAVLAKQTPPCSGSPYKLAKSLTGIWQEYAVTDKGESLEGKLTSNLKAGGCAFTQEFLSVDDTFSFVSSGYVDPETGMWYETFVFSNGRVSNFRWKSDAADILISCVSCQNESKWRLKITNISANYYEAIEEHSADGGSTWKEGELTRTRRVIQ